MGEKGKQREVKVQHHRQKSLYFCHHFQGETKKESDFRGVFILTQRKSVTTQLPSAELSKMKDLLKFYSHQHQPQQEHDDDLDRKL